MLRAVVLTRSKLAKRVNVTFPFTRIFRIYVSFDWPRLLPHARPPTFLPLPPAVPFNLSHQHFFPPRFFCAFLLPFLLPLLSLLRVAQML